jgi:hypothetical protein
LARRNPQRAAARQRRGEADMRFSACIEWLFADEATDFAQRIRLCVR